MNIIKLDAIESTNDYLKSAVFNNTQVAYTYNQFKGKGQRGNKWMSEPGKNLAFSIKIYPKNIDIKDQFKINVIFSLLILNTLKALQIPDIKIKFPNDIMSGNKKICGILIELKVKGSEIDNIIIGFGLNVNQENFGELTNASSLKLISNLNYDLDGISNLFIQNLTRHNYLNKLFNLNLGFDKTLEHYNQNLYGLNSNSIFQKNKSRFTGKIKSITSSGGINILKKDGRVQTYNFDEIKMMY
ncbi:MAG: biotin--[acetyl-CoA-carboxylase] ligase [Flavobacteriales bacterium]|jgi:BirA family biotin operon repressor/biotin-[acetyl-CoA-carboxylase] ligase|nr:MAG: biotin--[acetyl-CoA-carboxylase] ligase [Flavobacteriales bacterium]